MLAEMHKSIADIVFDTVQEQLGIRLNRDKLLQGSTFPDRNPFMLHIPHTLEGSSGYIQETMENLTTSPFLENPSVLDRFSFKLGILIHFVSDSFCMAHNDPRYNNLIHHYVYENRLKHYFRNWQREREDIRFGNFSWQIRANPMEFIRELHTHYLSKVGSMREDSRFSVFASSVLALNVVCAAMEETLSGLLVTA